jgi:hypothetical protein
MHRIQSHKGKQGYRWYGQYRLPEEDGSQEITLRLHQIEEDDHRGLNRTENLRAIPHGSPDFLRLRPLRPDAESINRGVEDTLSINRASAKGWRRQMVDLLGHARLVNAITLARCRARQLVNPAAGSRSKPPLHTTSDPAWAPPGRAPVDRRDRSLSSVR